MYSMHQKHTASSPEHSNAQEAAVFQTTANKSQCYSEKHMGFDFY